MTLVIILNVPFPLDLCMVVFFVVMEDSVRRERSRSGSRSVSPLPSPSHLALSQPRLPSPNSRGDEAGREEEILPTDNVTGNFEDDNDTLDDSDDDIDWNEGGVTNN